MRMHDRRELDERFEKADGFLDNLIDKAALDISDKKIDDLEFKLALSGQLARIVNVETLLAVSANMVFRLAREKAMRDRLTSNTDGNVTYLPTPEEETELPYVPPAGADGA